MYLWKGLSTAPFTREAFLSPFYLWSWDTKSQVQSLSKASSPTEINQNIFSEVPGQACGTAGSWARGLWCNSTDPFILQEVQLPSSATTFPLRVFFTFPLFWEHLALFICSHFSLFFIPIKARTFQRERSLFNPATIAFSSLMESITQELCRSLQ